LYSLLSRAILAFALEYEAQADLSLAIAADIVRVISLEGARVRDLPALGGVSKESIAMALGFMQKRGFATLQTNAAKARVVQLTTKGRRAQEEYGSRTAAIEQRWKKDYGSQTIQDLRDALEPLSGEPLLRATEPYPECWRAKLPRPRTLPHFPMVLHRGGYPDGS